MLEQISQARLLQSLEGRTHRNPQFLARLRIWGSGVRIPSGAPAFPRIFDEAQGRCYACSLAFTVTSGIRRVQKIRASAQKFRSEPTRRATLPTAAVAGAFDFNKCSHVALQAPQPLQSQKEQCGPESVRSAPRIVCAACGRAAPRMNGALASLQSAVHSSTRLSVSEAGQCRHWP